MCPPPPSTLSFGCVLFYICWHDQTTTTIIFLLLLSIEEKLSKNMKKHIILCRHVLQLHPLLLLLESELQTRSNRLGWRIKEWETGGGLWETQLTATQQFIPGSFILLLKFSHLCPLPRLILAIRKLLQFGLR